MVLRVALLLMRPELDDATSVEMFLDSLHVESQKSMELYIIENIIAKTENLAMDFKNVLDLENLSHKYGNVYADPYFVGAFKMVPEGTMRRTIGDQRFNLHTIGYNPEAPHEYGYLLTQLQFQAWHVGKYSCARRERNSCLPGIYLAHQVLALKPYGQNKKRWNLMSQYGVLFRMFFVRLKANPEMQWLLQSFLASSSIVLAAAASNLHQPLIQEQQFIQEQQLQHQEEPLLQHQDQLLIEGQPMLLPQPLIQEQPLIQHQDQLLIEGQPMLQEQQTTQQPFSCMDAKAFDMTSISETWSQLSPMLLVYGI